MSRVAALLAAALTTVPRAASAQGTCYGGACADGYTGCGCSAECCRKHLQGSGGGGSGAGYTPYDAQMATMNMMMGVYESFLNGMMAGRRANETQAPQQAALGAQREVEAMQARIREQQAAAAAQAAFRERRDELSKQMKGEAAPDLSEPLAFKDEEPAPRRKLAPAAADPDAACRKALPHDFEDTDQYVREAAAWDRKCGSGKVADALLQAPTSHAAAVLLYESRLAHLWDKRAAQTADDVWEENRLLLQGGDLDGRLTSEDKKFVRDAIEAARPRTVFDPVDSDHPSLLENLPAGQAVPPAKTFMLGQAMTAAVETLDPAARAIRAVTAKLPTLDDLDTIHVDLPKGPNVKLPKLPTALKDWKGVGHWARAQQAAAEKQLHGMIAELGGGGLQNEENYGR